MTQLNDKLYKNSLILEKLVKLDKEERQNIVLDLLKNKSERELSEELGIPHSTIHDWKTLRQNNTEQFIHVSLTTIIRKLRGFKPSNLIERKQLERIKEIIVEILKDGI